MATRQKAYRNSRYGSYIEGNTVKKAAYQERWDDREYRQERESRNNVNERVRRNHTKSIQMDLPYVIMLTIAAICALYICVGYLKVQSSITSRLHNIETLEQQLEVLKSENDALQTRVNTYVDLDHVYQVASNDLGMVYAKKNQVILYNRTESEYVRQYEDIPGNR